MGMLIKPGQIGRLGGVGAGLYQLPTTNLVDEWDASIASSITVATGVSSWASQVAGGHALTQATASKQPVYDSAAKTVTTDGVDDALVTAAFALNQPATIVMVVKVVTWADLAALCDGLTNNTGKIRMRTATPQFHAFAGTATTNNSNLVIGSFVVISAVFNGASSLTQVNMSSPVTGNCGVNNMGGFTLGGSGGGAAGAWSNASFKHIGLYNTALSNVQIDAISSGLMQRWGV